MGVGVAVALDAHRLLARQQQTSKMLSGAPGFFVDHEDGEGLGNDVFFRGFDLEHGRRGRPPASVATHLSTAAPTTLLGTVALHF